MTTPTPVTPIDAAAHDVTDRLAGAVVSIPKGLLERLAASGAAVLSDEATRAEAGRDWWPLAIGWATEGAVPQRPAVVVRPTTTAPVRSRSSAASRSISWPSRD